MRTTSKDEIIKHLKKHQKQLKAFGVAELGIFGSFITKNVNTNSDLDILVVFEPNNKTFHNFIELSFFLENLFQRTVDLVTPDSLSPHFGSKILSEVEYVLLS